MSVPSGRHSNFAELPAVGIATVAVIVRYGDAVPGGIVGAGQLLAGVAEVIFGVLPPFARVADAVLVARRQDHAELIARTELVGEHHLAATAEMRRAAVAGVAAAIAFERRIDAIAVDHDVAALKRKGAARDDVDDPADRRAILFGGEGLVDVVMEREFGRNLLQIDLARTLAVIADRRERDPVDHGLVEIGRDAPDADEPRCIAILDRADTGQQDQLACNAAVGGQRFEVVKDDRVTYRRRLLLVGADRAIAHDDDVGLGLLGIGGRVFGVCGTSYEQKWKRTGRGRDQPDASGGRKEQHWASISERGGQRGFLIMERLLYRLRDPICGLERLAYDIDTT
jgi:hypothetical protein